MAEQELLFPIEDMANIQKPEWDLPDLASLPSKLEGSVIAIDLETRDDGIQANQGSGWPWGGGHVVGYAIAAENWTGYMPVAHATGGNCDPVKVRAILNRWLSDKTQAKVGANLLYDYGWADNDGVRMAGPLHDVQYAAALIDEQRWSYSLNSLAKDYLKEEKDETLLQRAAKAWGVDAKGGLWQLPAQFVAQYAETDAVLALKLHNILQDKLKAEGLLGLYDLEVGLIRLYHEMRKKGVRVDMDRATQLRDNWRIEIQNIIKNIKDKTGYAVDIWSAESLGKALRHEGLTLNVTEKTKKVSITSDWLRNVDHWLPRAILKARELDKLSETFIDNAILGHAHKGRIHTELHPLRRNDDDDSGLKGTVTGRMSSTNPNLQQVPTRTEEGRQLRTLFLPEDGEQWLSADYSNQEPRLLVHYAASRTWNGKPLTGVEDAVKKYQDDPNLSYHKIVAEQTGLDYKKAKIMNLAILYGRGSASTARELKCTVEEAKAVIQQYHERLPFVKQIQALLTNDVVRNGHVATVLGRKARFTLFEPADWELAKKVTAVPYWKAKKLWPTQKLRLAGLHKVLNRALQGSASDQTKKALKDMYDAGLGKHLYWPIHDETTASVPDMDVAKKIRDCMVNAIPLKVPVVVAAKLGPNWGDVKETEL